MLLVSRMLQLNCCIKPVVSMKAQREAMTAQQKYTMKYQNAPTIELVSPQKVHDTEKSVRNWHIHSNVLRCDWMLA